MEATQKRVVGGLKDGGMNSLMEINHAQVLAIHRAIKITAGMEMVQQTKLIVESDSANAVHWCNGPWNLSFIINFIRCAIKRGNGVEIIYKGRESNMVADSMAKPGLTTHNSQGVTNSYHGCKLLISQ